MKKPSRFLRVVGAAGMLIGLIAASVSPAVAQQNLPGGPAMDHIFQSTPPSFVQGTNAIYYPWVANDDDFGLGAADTSVSVQNLEDRDAQIWIYVGNGDNTWTLAQTTYLAAYAAKAFAAADLGIAEETGAPVAVLAYQLIAGFTLPGVPSGGYVAETAVILSKPADVEGDFTQVLACVANAYNSDGTLGSPYPFVAAVDFTFNGVTYLAYDPSDPTQDPADFLVEWDSQADLQAIIEAVNAGNAGALINPFGGLNTDGDCFDAFDASVGSYLDSVTIGGVAKQAVDGERLPTTGAEDTAVSGYNAVNGLEVQQFNDWYLPVVQTNCGPGGCWNSMLRVANVSDLNSAVTVRFFPANDGSGSLQAGFQAHANLNGGATWHIDLSTLVPDGWVGSAHIFSDGDVLAMVDRYKVGDYHMWLTNTGSAADFENVFQAPANGRYALFAPHVLMDYFGWNTGINVANLVDWDNDVSIQYFNMLGNATEVLNERLAPHGMTYVYDPSQAPQDNNAQDVTEDPNAGVVGSAIVWSTDPVAVAVDATKYPDTDPNGGTDILQGTSYSATQNVYTWQAVSLVQRGDPVDGMGDTSGINIMNPNADAVTANVYYVNPSGFNAQNFGTSSVTIPGYANGFVYTLTQRNMPIGFTGAAQVVASLPVAAVSANVNYQVEGDGAAIYNAFNPCGFYRLQGPDCYMVPPTIPQPGDNSFTKYFVDERGSPVSGVNFSIVGDNPAFPYQRDGVSGPDGSRTFSNLPPGGYGLYVTGVPAGYVLPDPTVALDVFTIDNTADIVLTNTITWAQGFTKTVCASGSVGAVVSQDGIECADGSLLGGVDIVVYENIGEDFLGAPVAGDIVFEGTTDATGTVASGLDPGNYILCMWDEDEEATTEGGETVNPVLPNEVTPTILCASELFGVPFEVFGDLFTVEPGVMTELVNSVFLESGTVNIFLWQQGDTTSMSLQQEEGQVPVEGVEVCLYDYDTHGNEYKRCAVSEADGWVKVENVPGTFFDLDGDATPTSYELNGRPEEFFTDEALYGAAIYTDDYQCVNMVGGELTASVNSSSCFHGEPDLYELNQELLLEFSFYYSPTWDLAQDGYVDDVDMDGVLRGSYDLTVELAPIAEEQ